MIITVALAVSLFLSQFAKPGKPTLKTAPKASKPTPQTAALFLITNKKNSNRW
jgi:hypothetical protein